MIASYAGSSGIEAGTIDMAILPQTPGVYIGLSRTDRKVPGIETLPRGAIEGGDRIDRWRLRNLESN